MSDNSLLRFLIGVCAVLAVYYFLSFAGEVVMPFFLAVVGGYLLNPAIALLEARGFRRDRLVMGFYVLAVVLVVLAANILIPFILEAGGRLQAKLPEYMALLRRLPVMLDREVVQKLPIGSEAAASGLKALQARLQEAGRTMPQTLLGVVPLVLGLGLIPFVMYFVLLEGPAVIEGFVRICPSRHVEKVLSLICQVDQTLGNYIRGLLLEAAGVSLVAWAGLSFLGVHHALEIGLVTGFTNMIPYLGPVAGGLLGAAVAFAQFQQFPVVLKVFALAGVVQFVDNWVLQPAIMQTAVDLHPVLLIFSLLVGAQLFGFWGLLFAVPAVCVLKEALGVLYDWYVAESGLKKSSLSRHALRLPYV